MNLRHYTITELISILNSGISFRSRKGTSGIMICEGRRRDNTRSYTLNSEPALFADLGFTAQEFLPDFNLYNMLSAAKSRCSSGNGRLYDPVVGRFLSPDPYVQAPGFTQSYNRYSYCLNNPLLYFDPTGEKWKWKWLNPFYWFSEGMQWVNDNTSGVRQKMVDAGVPDFSIAASVNGDGNVNVRGSYRGEEVLNTGNIDKSNAEQVVLNEMAEVRQSYEATWMETTYIEQGLYFLNYASSVYNNVVFNNVTLEMGLAFYDFQRNYADMRQANWRKSDKYFHAKANFQASHRGPFGYFFAEHFSNLREIWDQRIKGYPRSDSYQDQKANRFGREQSKHYGPNDYRKALEIYRPHNLPYKY